MQSAPGVPLPPPPIVRGRRSLELEGALVLAGGVLTVTGMTGFVFLAFPLGVTLLVVAIIRLGWGAGSAPFSKLARKVKVAQALAIVIVFLAAGGARYAYGSQDTLTADLYVPFAELTFGANESYATAVQLHNVGLLPVRLYPGASLVVRQANGVVVTPNWTCPAAASIAPGPPTDGGSVEIEPDGYYSIPLGLTSHGATLESGCPRWDLAFGESYTLSARVWSYDRALTLPTWQGRIETRNLTFAVTPP